MNIKVFTDDWSKLADTNDVYSTDEEIFISDITSKNVKENNEKIDGIPIVDILTVNGIRFTLEDGSWGLIRASSNKPSLVVVTESPTSDDRKKQIFYFIEKILRKTGKVCEYDQKI